jgi:hypothetical protein
LRDGKRIGELSEVFEDGRRVVVRGLCDVWGEEKREGEGRSREFRGLLEEAAKHDPATVLSSGFYRVGAVCLANSPISKKNK